MLAGDGGDHTEGGAEADQDPRSLRGSFHSCPVTFREVIATVLPTMASWTGRERVPWTLATWAVVPHSADRHFCGASYGKVTERLSRRSPVKL